MINFTKILKIAFISFITLSAPLAVQGAEAENTATGATTAQDGAPQIVFAEKSYNFGIVPEKGGPITHYFEFTNTGDAPLVIISATASCGCTRPSYPTEPIAPGKKGKIKVTYLPEGRPGEFDKVIKVRTNAKDTKKISLTIRGTVKP